MRPGAGTALIDSECWGSIEAFGGVSGLGGSGEEAGNYLLLGGVVLFWSCAHALAGCGVVATRDILAPLKFRLGTSYSHDKGLKNISKNL